MLGDQEHKYCSPPFFQFQGMMREETDPADTWLVSLAELWGFCPWVSLHDTGPAGDIWGTPAYLGEKDLCTDWAH